MRILHTADLHLGRQFNGLDLERDHAAVLDQVVDAVIANKADVLIIAGDIFDRATPPISAVKQLNGFLTRVNRETAAAVVLIAGNHDSGHKITSMSVMADERRALVRGVVLAAETPLIIEDSHGPVAFFGIPFSFEYAARECFSSEEIRSPHDVVAAQMLAAKASLPPGIRWVVVAHTFVAGGDKTDSERPLTKVGGIETVAASLFEGANYVALGHLHRPQSVTEAHIRYAGSPLQFGFDEVGASKSMTLAELDENGRVTVSEIPFRPLRGVRVLKGKLAELIAGTKSEDFIKVVLTDEFPVIDAMKRVREIFPNACLLSYERDQRSVARSTSRSTTHESSPLEVVRNFVSQMRGKELSEPEEELVSGTLQNLVAEED